VLALATDEGRRVKKELRWLFASADSPRGEGGPLQLERRQRKRPVAEWIERKA
jgi:hypothetical protein